MLKLIEQQFLRLGSQIVPEMIVGRSEAPVRRVKLSFCAKSCIVEAIGLLTMLQTLPDLAGNQLILSGIQNGALQGEDWAS